MTKMKKIIALLMTTALLLTLAACNNNGNDHDHDHDHGDSGASGEQSNTPHTHDPSGADVEFVKELDFGFEDVISSEEDEAYHDLFYDKNTSAYENKKFTKEGIYAVIFDAFNEKERYYVWGYGHDTRDCCYQWEFIMPEGTEIPAPGSLIEVKGTMTHSDDALDGYWLSDASLTVKKAAEKQDADYDLVSMSPTLMRVQIINMLNKSDSFKDVTVRIPGKTVNENTIAPAFTDDEWTLHFTSAKSHINADSLVIIEGIFNTSDNANMIKSEKITAEE